MRFYDNNGYFDFRAVRDLGCPFTLVIGGRGTGKTYGALKTSIEDGLLYMFMRRKQTQLDIINRPEFSPIKPVCRDTGWQYTMRPVAKGLAAFVPYVIEDERETVTGSPVGYTCALSTVANLRGFDASEISLLLYDEFIPEKSERPLTNEADALLNCYETFNRNRELDGQRPLQMVCMANANDQTAPLLEYFRLIKRIDKMRRTGQELYIDRDRGLALVVLRDSPISERKRDTALYKLTAGTEFSDMALANDFAYEERGAIVSRPLAEYRPLAQIGELVIYRHKSAGRFYASTHRSGTPPQFGTGSTELARFRRTYGWLWLEVLDGNMEYEDFLCQALLTKYLT